MSAGFWEAALGPDRTFYVTGDDEEKRSERAMEILGGGWLERGRTFA